MPEGKQLRSLSSFRGSEHGADMWTVEFDKEGKFNLLDGMVGNFRITCEDKLHLFIPAGVLKKPLDSLLLINPQDEYVLLNGKFDDTGNWAAEWKSTVSGPHVFKILYNNNNNNNNDCKKHISHNENKREENQATGGGGGEGKGVPTIEEGKEEEKKEEEKKEEKSTVSNGIDKEEGEEEINNDTSSSSSKKKKNKENEKKANNSTTEEKVGETVSSSSPMNGGISTSSSSLSSKNNSTILSALSSSRPIKPSEELLNLLEDREVCGCANVIIVEPKLSINGVTLLPNAVVMQTVLSRCLGPFSRWKRMLKSVADLNYNVIHFTPLQTTGESSSCYSLANQNEISSFFFNTNNSNENNNYNNSNNNNNNNTEENVCKKTEEEMMKEVEEAVRMLEREYGMLSTTDLVLNHTANNSAWVAEHPECGYNLENSPHLRGAYELDVALQKFSSDLVDGKFAGKYDATKHITNEDQLNKVIAALRGEAIIPFKIKEWFEIDVEKCKQNYRQAKPPKTPPNCSKEHAKNVLKKEALKTVGVRRGPAVEISGEMSRCVCSSENQLTDVLNWIQGELYGMGHDAENFIGEAVRGLLRWERIECKKGPVGKNHWEALTPRYFTPVKCKNGIEHFIANNGWVMGWDAREDFTAAGSLVYIRRELVVWSDCIKLRYGSSPKDAPFLWEWMGRYCRSMAKIFHGVRLDNCHSTPLHVAKHMLREARKERPNLWVYAELFTGEQNVDLHFERELGLNALIREAMQTHSPKNLSDHVVKYGGRTVGSLANIMSVDRTAQPIKMILKPSLCPALFFDCTHDNETPAQKRTPADSLSTAAMVCASACAVGSTRGFDELVPHNLSVVTERRLYQDYHNDGGGGGVEEEETDGGEEKQKDRSTCNNANGTEAEGNDKPKKVKIKWRHNGGKVVIRGEWDGWKNDVVCEKQNDGSFLAELIVGEHLDANVNEYQYKFVVDGGWCHDGDLPCVRDNYGNINNVFSIDGKKPLSAQAWHPGDEKPGIMKAKLKLNELHVKMGQEGYDEVYIDQKTDDIVVIQRYNPLTNACIYFVIRSAFWWGDPNQGYIPEIEISGKIKDTHLACTLWVGEGEGRSFKDDPARINGLKGNLKLFNNTTDIANIYFNNNTKNTCIKFKQFPMASVLVFSTEDYTNIYEEVNTCICKDLPPLCKDVPMTSLNVLLFSCENEERDRSQGKRGLYDVPGHGPLVYAGICGLIPVLNNIRISQNMAHPLCSNIREGDWLMSYTIDHMSSDENLNAIKEWLTKTFDIPKRTLPRGLLPYYFDWIVSSLYSEVIKGFLVRMPTTLTSISHVDEFIKSLVIASLQFYAYVPSAPLIWGKPVPSLAAGLPHFSSGFMRNWGRDTFISIRGILLVTGRFAEAKEEILGYARVCRHSLIPNLLDSGNNPRYNARDATWFFMQSIQDYCMLSPEGNKFLLTPVQLKYGDAPGQAPVTNIADLMHRIMQSHAQVIEFREVNAGKQIDEHMTDEGFNVRITFDASSGVVYGGSEWNCGTWMDKMGSSAKAGNKGIPATPRDGAAVEIIGLIKSALRFLCKLPEDVFPYKTVSVCTGQELTYIRWNSLLEARFEKLFYVPKAEEDSEYFVDSKLINKREIYKDTHKATHPWCDYQLRPNVCVAMAVAPEMFNEEHAVSYLNSVEKYLFGEKQLGLKTLDESDYLYRGDYDNANDSDDKNVAHGFNYHQGPEWLWPLGFFLQAKLIFMGGEFEEHSAFVKHECMRFLRNHRAHMKCDPWMSLPELTNRNGRFCVHSCQAQAWSIATILSFLSLLSHFSKNTKLFMSIYKKSIPADQN